MQLINSSLQPQLVPSAAALRPTLSSGYYPLLFPSFPTRGGNVAFQRYTLMLDRHFVQMRAVTLASNGLQIACS